MSEFLMLPLKWRHAVLFVTLLDNHQTTLLTPCAWRHFRGNPQDSLYLAQIQNGRQQKQFTHC